MKFYSLLLGLTALTAFVGCSSNDDPAPAPIASSFTFVTQAASPLQADGSFGNSEAPTQPWVAPANSALNGVSLMAPAGTFTGFSSVTLKIDASDIAYRNPGNLPILSPVVRLQTGPTVTTSLAKNGTPSNDLIHLLNGQMTIRIPFTLPAGQDVNYARLYYEDANGSAVRVGATLEGVPAEAGSSTSHAFIYTSSWATRFWVVNTETLVNATEYFQLFDGYSWNFASGESVSIQANGANHPNLDHLSNTPRNLEMQESRQYIMSGNDGYYLAGELDFDGPNEIEYIYLDEKAERPVRWLPHEIAPGQAFTRKVRIEKRTDYLQGFVSEPTLSEVTITRTFTFLDDLNTEFSYWADVLVVEETTSEGDLERLYFAKGIGLVLAEEGIVGGAIGSDYVINGSLGLNGYVAGYRRIDTRPYFLLNAGNRWDFEDGGSREVFDNRSTPNLPTYDGTLLELRHNTGSFFFANDEDGAALVAETGEIVGEPIGNFYQNIYRGQGGPLVLRLYPKLAEINNYNAYADLDHRVAAPDFSDTPVTSIFGIDWSYQLLASHTTPYGTFTDVLGLAFDETNGGRSGMQYFARGVGLIQIDSRESTMSPWTSTYTTGGMINGTAITPPPVQ